MDFLDAQDSEIWVKELNREFGRFFTERLRLQEVANSLRSMSEPELKEGIAEPAADLMALVFGKHRGDDA